MIILLIAPFMKMDGRRNYTMEWFKLRVLKDGCTIFAQAIRGLNSSTSEDILCLKRSRQVQELLQNQNIKIQAQICMIQSCQDELN